MTARKNKKRKKIRYSEIRIRLSSRQKKSLVNYCHARKTTPNKLIKKMIRPYISNYSIEVPDEYYISEKQLTLFEDKVEEEF
ncbi:MAG: RepB family protein [Bacteroidales bacterium]|nr:RepB family protein [Bacteroidales bacterium]